MKEEEVKTTWPAGAQALARSLLRTDKLTQLKGDIELTRRTETFNARWNQLSSRQDEVDLYSPTAWVTRSGNDGTATIIRWCDGKERGVISQPFQLGRVRVSTALDLSTPPFELGDYSLVSIERSYPGYTATIEPQGQDRTTL